jgi:hypothetical protein
MNLNQMRKILISSAMMILSQMTTEVAPNFKRALPYTAQRRKKRRRWSSDL